MFLKTQALKLLKKIDTNLQHKSISMQLATPRSIATFYLGYQLYIRFVDYQVRKQIAIQRNCLIPYINLFASSEKSGLLIQNCMLSFGFLSSAWAYFQSKNLLWMIGGSFYLGIFGYEWFFIRPLKQKLLNEEIERFMTQKKQMEKNKERFGLIQKVTRLFNGKIFLSLLTVVAFFVAELKHSQQVDVKLSLRN